LTPQQCAELYEALLRDSIGLATSVPPYVPFLAFTPPEGRVTIERLAPEGIQLIVQTGEDLGERLYSSMLQAEEGGYSPVVLMGSDVPCLQPATLLEAIERLKTCGLCLGPARDGGYYLIGMKNADRRVFLNIPWSTSSVLRETLQRASEAGVSVALLEEEADIDTVADLKLLASEVLLLRRTAGVRVPANTELWLENNIHVLERAE
jgi:rSAM/selenodomain-associated transferase 1